MQTVLVSRCLLGEPVRYDGQSKALQHPLLQRWLDEGRLVPICPEMAGGLPCPRPAAEISGGRGQHVLQGRQPVLTQDGTDVSAAFIAGAQAALALCQQHDIGLALLKARSPSCATHQCYDGQFNGTLTDAMGVTAALLHQHGIRVFDETELDKLAQQLSSA